jgi:hypothetical protein
LKDLQGLRKTVLVESIDDLLVPNRHIETPYAVVLAALTGFRATKTPPQIHNLPRKFMRVLRGIISSRFRVAEFVVHLGASADEILQQIQEELLENPEKGDVAEGLGGIRKARSANPTRGKASAAAIGICICI